MCILAALYTDQSHKQPGPALAETGMMPTWVMWAPVLPAHDAPVLPHAGLAHDGLQVVESGEPGPL